VGGKAAAGESAERRLGDLSSSLLDPSEIIGMRLCRILTGAARSLLVSGDGTCPLEQMLRADAVNEATQRLLRAHPQYSAARVLTRRQRNILLALVALAICVVGILPRLGGLFLIGAVATAYLANAVFRGWLFWVGADHPVPPEERTADAQFELPMYTVLVPLFREANMLPQVANAMRQLDYPGIR
jgi:hypothetical protein